MPDVAAAKKTLVFCTSFVGASPRAEDIWRFRYRRWLDAILSSDLTYDQILLVDDGSPTLPDWPDVVPLTFLPPDPPRERVVLFHFRNNLGRAAVYDYPGWFRSFTFVATYAQAYGFERIIHIESDAYLISSRIQQYCNEVEDDWVTFLGPRHDYPETAIQVIAGRSLALYYDTCARPYEDFAGKAIEEMLPFTRVERGFLGDRFGEYLTYVPQEADWTTQAPSVDRDRYYWWLQRKGAGKGKSMYEKELGEDLRHTGVLYVDFMATMSTALSCRTYFEIGTDIGISLKAFKCDAVCVDPHFKVSQDVLQGRRHAHFFQMTSDTFFEHYDVRACFPGGIDVAFLDGLHRFEALLRDFINTEKFCSDRSVILLHDCLPLNTRMAEREARKVEDEDASTRDFWTGDVWRLLPILRKYRPDLRIMFVDCPPTGLVVCTGLDPYSRVLSRNYDEIIDEYRKLDLSDFGLRNLWSVFPMLDSRELSGRLDDIPRVLFAE